ncbi:tripartite motif-containing protein 59-like [Huso huso]|uniref:Tripartite motif-containing protein 59-like n=1 Tax=Huso huso TaxID=61971 RepID=A0ABR0Z1I2_HUSHU
MHSSWDEESNSQVFKRFIAALQIESKNTSDRRIVFKVHVLWITKRFFATEALNNKFDRMPCSKSLCYSLFDDSRVLPCSHAFCKGCLENVCVSVNFSIWRRLIIPLKCPNCRNLVELPPTGVDSFPVNVSEGHRRKISKKRSNKITFMSGTPRTVIESLLSAGLSTDLWIVPDRRPAPGAPYKQPAACLHERETPGRHVEQLTDKCWAEVCLLVERLEEQKVKCDNTIKHKEAVVQYFETINRILESKKQAFLAVLEKASAEVSSEFDPLIEKLKDIKEEQLDLISYSTAVEEEESPLVFLEKIHTF